MTRKTHSRVSYKLGKVLIGLLSMKMVKNGFKFYQGVVESVYFVTSSF